MVDEDTKCPLCGGDLRPGMEVPGYAICVECKTWWQESALITLQVRKDRERAA